MTTMADALKNALTTTKDDSVKLKKLIEDSLQKKDQQDKERQQKRDSYKQTPAEKVQ